MPVWIHGRRAPVFPAIPLRRIDVVLALGLSLTYLGYFLLLQPLIIVRDGLGWDGADYFLLAQGNYTDPVYPLVQRVGMPWLAATGPTADLLLNFRLWNGLFAFLHGVVTWILIARLDCSGKILLRVAAWCMVCANQLAPIPGAIWMPVQNDIAAALLSQCLLLALLSGYCHGWFLLIIFFAGTLCRENFAQYAIFFLFRWDLRWQPQLGLPAYVVELVRRNLREALLLLSPALIGYLVATMLVNQYVDKGMTLAERYTFYVDGVRWHHFSDVLLGWIGGLSPFLFIFFFHRLRRLPPVESPLPWAPVCIILGIFLVISLGAGLNTERYLYWMFPFLAIQAMPFMLSLYQHGCRSCLLFCFFYTLFMYRTVVTIDAAGLIGCAPVHILYGNAAFLGHFAQQCADTPMPLLEFFFGLVLPLAVMVGLWSPRQRPQVLT